MPTRHSILKWLVDEYWILPGSKCTALAYKNCVDGYLSVFLTNRFLTFSLNESVTVKSRSRTIKIGHDNAMILGYHLVKFGHKTRKSGAKKGKINNNNYTYVLANK